MPSRRRQIVQEQEEDESEEERRPTQSTQKGRRQAPVSDDEDEDQAEEDDGDEMDVDGAEPQDQVVKKLVRYALACEFQRVRITRTGMAEKAIGKQRGAGFKRIFEAAQKDLRIKFGMEIVPLPANEKVTVKQKRAAAKSGVNNAKSTTSAYILTSILPPEYKRGSIMPPSMISSSKEEAQYMAMCTTIVALVSFTAGGLPDYKLNQYLQRVNLDTNTPLGNIKDTLARMRKDGYLNRVAEQNDSEETITWHVGPRGKTEISNKAIRGFVHEVYGDRAPEDLDKRLQRSLGMDVKKVGPTRNEEAAAAAAAAAANGGAGPSTQGGRGRRRRAADESDEDD